MKLATYLDKTNEQDEQRGIRNENAKKYGSAIRDLICISPQMFGPYNNYLQDHVEGRGWRVFGILVEG